jgi:hypothetical protein
MHLFNIPNLVIFLFVVLLTKYETNGQKDLSRGKLNKKKNF